jgi:hypothetical protein
MQQGCSRGFFLPDPQTRSKPTARICLRCKQGSTRHGSKPFMPGTGTPATSSRVGSAMQLQARFASAISSEPLTDYFLLFTYGLAEQVPIRHSGADRTKAHRALNACRVSAANHPGKSSSWTPAFAGVTTCSGFPYHCDTAPCLNDKPAARICRCFKRCAAPGRSGRKQAVNAQRQ